MVSRAGVAHRPFASLGGVNREVCILSTIDKPNYDSWDPLTTLAGVAGVTSRARLATTILQLPPRNEVLVAKHAAVVDQLSGGHLVLGVAQGGREDDYEVLGAPFSGRSARFERQVSRIREMLILFPQIASLDQVERLAEEVLPAYAEPESRAA